MSKKKKKQALLRDEKGHFVKVAKPTGRPKGSKDRRPRKLRTDEIKRIPDPRQQDFMNRYYDPKSPTFANAKQSAIDAGYSEGYANIIRAPSVGRKWIREGNQTHMNSDHIIAGITRIAHSSMHDKDKLKAYELLAKLEGMLDTQKTTVNVVTPILGGLSAPDKEARPVDVDVEFEA